MVMTVIIYRFPRNEGLRWKWFDSIGAENITHIHIRHKELFVCSLHFKESDLNRTLDQMMLRKDVVPTLFHVVNIGFVYYTYFVTYFTLFIVNQDHGSFRERMQKAIYSS